MRIGMIHATQNAVEPLNQAFHELAPEAVLLNFVNEDLLAHANQVGGVDAYGFRTFLKTLFQAVDAGVDGIVIACTIYCPYRDLAASLTEVPVLAVDQPMISKAVTQGKKIGVLATTPSSAPSAVEKLEVEAKRQGKSIDTEWEIIPEAMTALKAGQEAEHNRLLAEAAVRLKEKGCDVLILAQITMACAREACGQAGAPALSSPREGAERMLELLQTEKGQTA